MFYKWSCIIFYMAICFMIGIWRQKLFLKTNELKLINGKMDLIMSQMDHITNIPHFSAYPLWVWSSRKLIVGLRIKHREFRGSLLFSQEPLPTRLRKTDCWRHLFHGVSVVQRESAGHCRGQPSRETSPGTSHCSHLKWESWASLICHRASWILITSLF